MRFITLYRLETSRFILTILLYFSLFHELYDWDLIIIETKKKSFHLGIIIQLIAFMILIISHIIYLSSNFTKVIEHTNIYNKHVINYIANFNNELFTYLIFRAIAGLILLLTSIIIFSDECFYNKYYHTYFIIIEYVIYYAAIYDIMLLTFITVFYLYKICYNTKYVIKGNEYVEDIIIEYKTNNNDVKCASCYQKIELGYSNVVTCNNCIELYYHPTCMLKSIIQYKACPGCKYLAIV
jgi:hypothetical protein